VNYWRAKADLAFMEEFDADVRNMWKRVDAIASWRPPFRYTGPRPKVTDDTKYRAARARIAKGMNRAQAIATRLNIGPSMSYILAEAYHRVPRQTLVDLLNQTVGACEAEVAAERRHIWNPLWWLLYGPFVLLQSAGVDTAKFEKKWWSRALVQITFGVITGLIVWATLAAFGAR
jgi:hypothetical protein